MRVGSSYLNLGGTLYTVTNKWIHPEYDSARLVNDVGLLKLAPSLFCSPTSVTLNRDDDFPSQNGQPLTVLGFGRTTDDGGPSGVLKRLVVDFVGNAECAANDGDFEEEVKICADKEGAGTCQGDSGSPLFHRDESTGVISQVGIVSYGLESCASRFADYYARVSAVVDWVESTMEAEMTTCGGEREPLFSFLRRNGPQWIQMSWQSMFG